MRCTEPPGITTFSIPPCFGTKFVQFQTREIRNEMEGSSERSSVTHGSFAVDAYPGVPVSQPTKNWMR